MEVLFLAFITTFIAEMGDKTQIATLVMACRNRNFVKYVFFGAMTALAIITGVAVIVGDLLADIIPPKLLLVVSASLFIILGLINYFQKDNSSSESKGAGSGFIQTFSLVFISELGDKTQLVALALAALYKAPAYVFAGAMLGQAINHGLAAFVGSRVVSKIPKPYLKLTVSAILILLGIIILLFELA